MAPSSEFSMALEGSRGWEPVFLLLLFIAVTWALQIIVRAIKNKQKNYITITIIGFLLCINVYIDWIDFMVPF